MINQLKAELHLWLDHTPGDLVWTQVLTSYARVNDWAGVSVGLRHPVRRAVVSSLNPTHQSAVVGRVCARTLSRRCDWTPGLRWLTWRANSIASGPVACASMIGPLAQAQLAGQLHIRPEKVVAASEVLTSAARAAARAAWGAAVVVDSYAATETASIASTCSRGDGICMRIS